MKRILEGKEEFGRWREISEVIRNLEGDEEFEM